MQVQCGKQLADKIWKD